MGTATQEKFSISVSQKELLADYKKWGFSGQGRIVRGAFDRFIREIRVRGGGGVKKMT
jgi:hypothetical protein